MNEPTELIEGRTRKRCRRPSSWIYDVGDEPDPRFTLANERTFLAWVRTSLALLAASIASNALVLDLSRRTSLLLSTSCAVLALAAACAAWFRWARTERALRLGRNLPRFRAGAGLCVVLTALILLSWIARA